MVFTPTQLAEANGADSELIHLAVQGKVYDVGERDDLYGPGGKYNIFAGKDCTRAFALMSTSGEECNRRDVDDLNSTHRATLRQWIKVFSEKYVVVGDYSPVDACIVDLSKDDPCEEKETQEAVSPAQRFSFRKWCANFFAGEDMPDIEGMTAAAA
jgi:membrane-associated progesterone receptor component